MSDSSLRKKRSATHFPSDEMVKELTQRQNDLTDAFQRLINFQRQTLVLKNSPSMEKAFDSMESLLLDVIDFEYASLQFRGENGEFVPLREIRPPGVALDNALMEWVMDTQEVAVVPIEPVEAEFGLRSLLLLPFGHRHIMALWLEQVTDAFTQEQEAMLSILSREMAAVLEAHHFRSRLEKTRAAMSDIIESVPLGLVALDHNRRVQMINSTAEIALRVRRQDAVGKPYAESFPRRFTELLDRMYDTGSGEEAEMPLSWGGGDEQYLGVTMTTMDTEEGADHSGKVVVCRDLQLSREVQKLRDLDSMKNDFLSLVSHELRTPLTSIMAYSETLLLDESDAVPKEWREYLEVIHGEGKRLCNLIDDVLDLTRMEAGKMTYQFDLHDVNEIVGAVVMSVTPLAEAKNHTLSIDLEEELGDCRMAVDRFTQVMNNVLSNAIKYTDPGGQIVVRTRKTDPFPGSAVPTVTITVEDNGIGIAAENLDKVFSKFEMIEAIRHHTAGTGLGMAICKQIVEEGHNGKIWLESEAGKGTKVHIRLPAR